MTILDEINKHKVNEVAFRKAKVPVDTLQSYSAYKTRKPSFSEFLLSPMHSGIIAEHKRMSPSKGIINGKVNVQEVVMGYQDAGASAVSVLTDMNYFGGTIYDLIRATEVLDIPILRKDFIIDEYQVYEAKALGASVILLIAASLSKREVHNLATLARKIGLEVLMEVHNAEELEKVSEFVNVVGVNNRNLKTFEVDVDISVDLFNRIPDRFIKISEGGISSPETVKALRGLGYKGFLMGENFMKEDNPGSACSKFISQIKE